MKKKSLLTLIVAMFLATGLTYAQHQYRPLPIYRYMDLSVDNQNVMDSSAAVLPNDTASLPFPDGPALTWGGWDTAHTQTTNGYNWYISYYTTGGYYELKANGYSSTSGNMVTDQYYISPYFSTNKYSNVNLSFSSKCAKYLGPGMTVLVSTDFRNESVTAAHWDTLSTANIPIPNSTSSSPWTHSGSLNLDAYHGDSVCIAFHYSSTTGAAATYYVDSIQITGTLAGIHEIANAKANVYVYPNPVTSNVTINSNDSRINNVEVYNVIGELVSSKENVNHNKYVMDITNLQSGIYFAKIQLKNGTTVARKIVKE